jgi:uncharacterized glyoxalase superfamily protein PhnB
LVHAARAQRHICANLLGYRFRREADDVTTNGTLPTVYPGVQYRNCPAAIDWLISILGFTRHLVVSGKAGRIEHAELRFGNGLVMVSSTNEAGLDWLGMPAGTANIALVADGPAAVDALYARVLAAGARIVRALGDSDYGEYGNSHGFTCLDPEGHRWSVGTYQPAARPPQ